MTLADSSLDSPQRVLKTRRHQKQVRDLQAVLEVSRAMNAERDINQLLRLIVSETTRVMDADRSSLFLVDADTSELYSKIAEGAEIKEIRFPNGVGIAGQVAETGNTINIPDAYADGRFNQEFDQKTGYKTRSILCMPLTTHEDKVVGVVQVLNKNNGEPFTAYDEYLLGAFASQAAVSIDNNQLIQHYLEKQKIQQALQIACEIQQRLLPEHPPELSRFDLAARSQACDETGGDYYDFLRLGPDQLGLVLGDVCGHGVGAALLMATARATLRALVDAGSGSISQVFARVNNLLEGDMEDEQFMTMFYGMVNLPGNSLIYTNAGHDSPLMYKAEQDEFTELESTSFPLGMFEEADFPCSPEIPIEVRDVLLVMTDGIWEVMNPEDEPFGRDRVREVLRQFKDTSAQQIADGLYEAADNFRGSAPVRDDMTIMVLKRLA